MDIIFFQVTMEWKISTLHFYSVTICRFISIINLEQINNYDNWKARAYTRGGGGIEILSAENEWKESICPSMIKKSSTNGEEINEILIQYQ